MPSYRWIVIVSLLLCHSMVFAQSESSTSDREQASARFRRGVELFQDDAFRAALVEFERAYELAPDYRVLYNIGQARNQLQDFLGATRAYEAYLQQGGSAIPGEQRGEVESALQSLRKRVGRISLTVNVDGAEVFIDDAMVGKTPIHTTIPVNVGRHRVAVRAPNGASDTKIVDVAGNEIAELSMEIIELETRVVIQRGPEGLSLQRKIAIAGWASGGALLIGALVTGVLASNADKSLDDMFKLPDANGQSVANKRDQMKTLVLTTDVLMASGAALAVAGTAFWLFAPKREEAPEPEGVTSAKLRLDVGLGSLAVRGQF